MVKPRRHRTVRLPSQSAIKTSRKGKASVRILQIK